MAIDSSRPEFYRTHLGHEGGIEELEAKPQGLQHMCVALNVARDALDIRDSNRLINAMIQRCEAVFLQDEDTLATELIERYSDLTF